MAVYIAHVDYRKTPENQRGRQVFKYKGQFYASFGQAKYVNLAHLSEIEFKDERERGIPETPEADWTRLMDALMEDADPAAHAVCTICHKMRMTGDVIHGMCGTCSEEAATHG